MKRLWWRILPAALVLEFAYGGILPGIFNNAELAYEPAGLALVFVLMLLGGFWIGRNAHPRHVLKILGAATGGYIGKASQADSSAQTS